MGMGCVEGTYLSHAARNANLEFGRRSSLLASWPSSSRETVTAPPQRAPGTELSQMLFDDGFWPQARVPVVSPRFAVGSLCAVSP